jgi:hypothetical protein
MKGLFNMKSFIFAFVALFALAIVAQAGEKSAPVKAQAPAPVKAQAPAPVKAQAPAPVKAQAPVKGEVAKSEVLIPLTNREKRNLNLYKKVEVVVSSAPCCESCTKCPCCESCTKCNTPKAKGGLFSRLRANRTATVTCENCSK